MAENSKKNRKPLLSVILIVIIIILAVVNFAYQPTPRVEWQAPAGTTSTKNSIMEYNWRKTVFLGDSYCAGAGASSQTKRWTTIAAKSLHWEEFNLCLGANEYFFPTSDTGEKVCGAATCVDYAAQISDAVATKPNVVIISGGRDSLGLVATNGDEFKAQICTLFSSVRKSLPKAEIVAIAPFWDATAVPNDLILMNNWIYGCATQYGAKYIAKSFNWLSSKAAISSDKVHPNDVGHQIIADKLIAWWNNTAHNKIA